MEETFDLQTFAADFLSLARRKLTGTYKVTRADGGALYLLIQDGLIIDVDTREEPSILASTVIALGRLSERDLRRARKVQAKTGQPLGAVLIAQAEVPEEELLAAVRVQAVDGICGLFAATIADAEFIEHTAEEKLEEFAGELSEVLEFYADPEELLIEASRRLDRWDLIEGNFGVLRDVYYATPGAFKYFREEERYPQEVIVIGHVDGRRDVAEVVDEAARGVGQTVDRFRAFSIIRSLIARGELELINPVQMFQLGGEFLTEGQSEKALKLFLRASERGLDDFDLGWKIAQATEALGRTGEAAARYQEFGDKCLAQFRPEEAVRSYRKSCELLPRDAARQEMLLKLLIQEGRLDDALAHGLHVAGRYLTSGNPREGLGLLLDLRARGLKGDRLGEKIIQLAEACGDETVLRAERERLASDFCSRKDVEKALAMYQEMFCEGNGTPEVRLKLIDLHLERGDRKLALEHIGAVLALGEGERIRDEEVLCRLHRTVCELKPGDWRSTRWLVDRYLRIGDRASAVGVLRNMAGHLEREGCHREAVLVLRQLGLLEPDCLEHLWRLAAAFARIGKTAERIEELRKVARLAIHGKDDGQAEKAFLEIIKASPFDVEARKGLADLCQARGEAARTVSLFKEVALLDILSGNLPEAQDYCRRLLVIEPRDPEIAHKLGELCRTLGDDQKAGEQLVKAARIHIENRNLGIAREALVHALELRPANAECLELKRGLEELDLRLQGQGQAPAAAAAPAPARPVREPDEPAPATPAVVKRSVAGITARLRNLKAGASAPPERTIEEGPRMAEPAEARHPAEAIPPAAPPTAAAPAAPPAAETPGGPVDVPTTDPVRAKGAGIASAASRLKALARGGAPEAPAARSPTPGPGPAAAAPSGGEPRVPVNREAAELERLKASLQSGGGALGGDRAPPAGPGRSISRAAEVLARLRKAGGAGAGGAKPPAPPPAVEERQEETAVESPSS